MAAILFKRFHRLNATKENQNILEKDAPAPVLNDYICQKKSFLLHTYPSLGQDYNALHFTQDNIAVTVWATDKW